MSASDVQLIQSARSGDQAARAELGERLSCIPRLISCIARRMGLRLGEADLRDVAQDVTAKALQKIETFQGRSKLETWLWSMAYLELMNFRRSRGRGPRLFSDSDDGAWPEIEDVPDRPAQGIEQWLRHLAAREADVVRMKHVDHLTFAEIARALDVKASTVKTSYYRGIEKLQELVTRRGAAEETS